MKLMEKAGLDMEPGETREGELTKTIEEYTAAIPSGTYLAVAVGAIGLALAAQLAGRGKWGNFIAQRSKGTTSPD